MDWRSIVIIIICFIVGIQIFLAFVIFPMLKKKRNDKLLVEQTKLLAAIKIGSEVLLTSGIYGLVREKHANHLIMTIAPNTNIKVAKDAVMGFFDAKLAEQLREKAKK